MHVCILTDEAGPDEPSYGIDQLPLILKTDS